MLSIPILDSNAEGELVPGYLDGPRTNPALGPYSLGGVLKSHQFDITIIDFVCEDKFGKNLVEALLAFDVILLSANSLNWSSCYKLIHWIKEANSEITLILGGVHATLFGEKLIERVPVDFIVVGEGEKNIAPLLHAIDERKNINGIPGILHKNKYGTVLRTAPSQLLTTLELDSLPMPLFEQLPDKQYKALSIESSRGCVNDCTFCASFYKKCWRPKSPVPFVDEIEKSLPFLSKTKLGYFAIIDDCFTVNHKRIIAILDEIDRRGITFRATYDARVTDFLDESLIERVKPYTKTVLVGAESISENTLQRIRKPLNPKQIEECAKNLHKYGMAHRVVFSFIIGFPWESKREILDNIRKIIGLILDYGIFVIFQWHALTPGSEMWHLLEDQNKISYESLDDIGYYVSDKCHTLSLNLTASEILDVADTIISLQKLLGVFKPFGFNRGDVLFSIPFYFKKHKEAVKTWRDNYERLWNDQVN
jgi:radical SAM superfamily enzyme YgiQ (UPF0313 family)